MDKYIQRLLKKKIAFVGSTDEGKLFVKAKLVSRREGSNALVEGRGKQGCLSLDNDSERKYSTQAFILHNPADNHYCMNAELFDEIIKNASFELELFFDMKHSNYAFAGELKKLESNFKEIKEG